MYVTVHRAMARALTKSIYSNPPKRMKKKISFLLTCFVEDEFHPMPQGGCKTNVLFVHAWNIEVALASRLQDKYKVLITLFSLVQPKMSR